MDEVLRDYFDKGCESFNTYTNASFTNTKERRCWQKLYSELRAIEAEKVAAGNPDGTYFSEDGNVWTMSSTDVPFTTEIVKVVFADSATADVYFWLKPAGSEHQAEADSLEDNMGIPILWELKKNGDRWLIQNFIEGDEDYYEYEYNYMEHIKDYIKRNQ